MSRQSTVLEPTGRAAQISSAEKRYGLLLKLRTYIDTYPARAFFALTVLYAVVVFSLSAMKLLWLDELITLHIARLSSTSAIWHALANGADPNPPVTHLLVHYARGLFGEHEFALRMPAAVGYWVGLLSLFLYLRSRLPATWALAGTVLSMTMAAFEYSYESRSYAIFYGLAMLAFLFWSRAADDACTPGTRRIALAGMVLALAAGLSTNYFAVLAFLPIAAGELARTLQRITDAPRRMTEQTLPSSLRNAANPRMTDLYMLDMRIWIGLIIASTPLLFFRSMIAHSIAEFAPHAWNKVSIGRVADAYTEMVEIVLYPILALLALYLLVRFFATLCALDRARMRPRWVASLSGQVRFSRATVPWHEAVAIFFFMAYPFLGYFVASVYGGMLSSRFVIPVCFGFAVAGTLAAYRLFSHLPLAAIVFLSIGTAWFLTRESVVGYWYEEQKLCFYNVLNHLPVAEQSVPQGAPILIPDPLLALTLQHYAPPALAHRFVFPIDFPAIRSYRRDDSPEQNIWAGGESLYALPIVPLATFQHAAGPYLIVASDGNWLLQDLNEHRYPVTRLPIETQTSDIGGFTPLAHGAPAFYVSSGDTVSAGPLAPELLPQPFQAAANLPDAR